MNPWILQASVHDWDLHANDGITSWKEFHDGSVFRLQKKSWNRKGHDVELPDHIGEKHDLTCDVYVSFAWVKENCHVQSHCTRVPSTTKWHQVLRKSLQVGWWSKKHAVTKIYLITTKCVSTNFMPGFMFVQFKAQLSLTMIF